MKNIWIFSIFLSMNLSAIDSDVGTLIVTYETDQKGHCIDRLKFWIINEKNERTLYPNSDEFVENHHSCTERTVAIKDLPIGKYIVKFVVPNRDNVFEIPSDRVVEITKDSVSKVEQKIKKLYDSLVFVDVPGGEAIVGDPFSDSQQNVRPAKKVMIADFSIGKYEVTNEQFAQWLNRAYGSGKISFDQKGNILTKEGHYVCKTTAVKNSQSQINVHKDLNGQISFSSVSDKENYPVIEVSWYGAMAFCIDHNCQLPSEAEWEKAAGMGLVNGIQSPTRYRFGFGQNEISPLWANYRVENTPIHGDKVLTTPVGYYNGTNTIEGVLTKDAKSPVGAYDMSGNVWEWVSSLDELNPSSNKRVMKGGCYDSLADGVRVSERLSASPDYSDIYTGFRVSKK